MGEHQPPLADGLSLKTGSTLTIHIPSVLALGKLSGQAVIAQNTL